LVLRFARGGAIAGIVLARGNSQPLVRARVLAEPEDGWPLQRAGQSVLPSAFTDAGGRFEIVGLPEGRFRIEAASDGFGPTRSDPVPTGTADLRLVLDAGLTVTGKVTVGDGLEAPGALVQLVEPDHQDTAYARWKRAVAGGPPVQTLTDRLGGFTLAGIRPAAHRLSIEHATSAPWLGQVLDGAPGARIDLGEIRLAPGARVGGVALDREGRPAAGAIVCLDGVSRGGAARTARADGRGRFEFLGLAGGDYELFYHYPERDGPLASPGMRERTLERIVLEPGTAREVTLAPN
jgi:hypothetical protein